MVKFIELPRANVTEYTPIWINPAFIVSVEPQWSRGSGVWTHTEVHMADGRTFKVDAALEQIEDAITGDAEKVVATPKGWDMVEAGDEALSN